jgi:hypothetical protein
MGHSYVSYRGKTVMLHDSAILRVRGLTTAYLRAHPHAAPKGGAGELFAGWAEPIEAYGSGCMGMDLDETLRTDADAASARRVLTQAMRWVAQLGTVISGHFLNQLVGQPGVFEFDDRPADKVCAEFAQLIGLFGPEALPSPGPGPAPPQLPHST